MTSSRHISDGPFLSAPCRHRYSLTIGDRRWCDILKCPVTVAFVRDVLGKLTLGPDVEHSSSMRGTGVKMVGHMIIPGRLSVTT